MRETKSLEDSTEISVMLERANLNVSAEEYAALVQSYPDIKQLVQRLRLLEARYVEPAVIYPASLPEKKKQILG